MTCGRGAGGRRRGRGRTRRRQEHLHQVEPAVGSGSAAGRLRSRSPPSPPSGLRRLDARDREPGQLDHGLAARPLGKPDSCSSSALRRPEPPAASVEADVIATAHRRPPVQQFSRHPVDIIRRILGGTICSSRSSPAERNGAAWSVPAQASLSPPRSPLRAVGRSRPGGVEFRQRKADRPQHRRERLRRDRRFKPGAADRKPPDPQRPARRAGFGAPSVRRSPAPGCPKN